MTKQKKPRLKKTTTQSPAESTLDKQLHHSLKHSEVAWLLPARHSVGEPVPRRVGLHDRLVDQGKINAAQWEWACRYVRESEIIEGGRDGKSDRERVDEGLSEPIYDRQTAAAGFLRLSHGRMTLAQRELMQAACVMAYRIYDIAMLMGLEQRGGTAAGKEQIEAISMFTRRVAGRVTRAVVKCIEAGSGIVEGVDREKTG